MPRAAGIDLNRVPASTASGVDLRRVRSADGSVLWQVHAAKLRFRDNTPVAVVYYLNAPGRADSEAFWVLSQGDIARDGQLRSGFSVSGWAQTAEKLDFGEWTMELAFTTGADVRSRQTLVFMPDYGRDYVYDAQYGAVGAWLGIVSGKLKLTWLHFEDSSDSWYHSDVGNTSLEAFTPYKIRVSLPKTTSKNGYEQYRKTSPKQAMHGAAVWLSRDGGLSWQKQIDDASLHGFVGIQQQPVFFGMSLAREADTKQLLKYGSVDVAGGAPEAPFGGSIDFGQSSFTDDKTGKTWKMKVQ